MNGTLPTVQSVPTMWLETTGCVQCTQGLRSEETRNLLTLTVRGSTLVVRSRSPHCKCRNMSNGRRPLT